MEFNFNNKTYQIKTLGEINPDNPDEFCIIPEFENYLINGQGKVWSLFRKNFLSTALNGSDFKVIKLHKDTIQKTTALHKLVANLFIPNPNNYKFISFNDDDKSNVHFKNLLWVENRKIGTTNKRNYATSRKKTFRT